MVGKNPFLYRHCVANREDVVIPAKAGIQVFEIVMVFNSLDARLHGHDELRLSLRTERGLGMALAIGESPLFSGRKFFLIPGAAQLLVFPLGRLP
jgi:hypothetical protein